MSDVESSISPKKSVPPNRIQKITLRISDKLDRIHSRFIGWLFRPWRIQIGKQTLIRRGAILSTKHGGSISIGNFCEISPEAKILTYGGDIKMGNYCTLNPNAIIYGQGGVTMGDGVRIAAHSVIIPSNHQVDGDADSAYRKPNISKGITIGNNVWIGTHCVILDGVHVAKGCVIAAGAVVTRSTEPDGIYAGVPARRIKTIR